MAANPCGCDPEAPWVCKWHREAQLEAELAEGLKVHLPASPLPTTDAERKALPIWDGTFGYFPDALVEVARVSRKGNDQHNPGEPLHWARGKSMDQVNTAVRHLLDHETGNLMDMDGTWHLAKACWRLLAELQLTIEKHRE